MEPTIARAGELTSLREAGAILLVSCYELGHQPIGIAQPLGFLEQAGYAPAAMDIAVEDFDERPVGRARFVGISVPMHTALRLGTRVAETIRSMNSDCHICFYGLYASLNTDYLLEHVADSVIGGEYEIPLVHLVEALEHSCSNGRRGLISPIEGVSTRGRIVPPLLRRMPASVPLPSRDRLPMLEKYARLERDGEQRVVGYVEASRGCLHHCLHCPIVPVYHGRFFLIPEESVLEDIRRLVKSGATHITFGDPDFLNGPGHSLSILRAMHAEFPHLTFDFTAKIEHILKRRALFPDLATLGCVFVVSAVESFSDAVLARLEKGHTRADALAGVDIVRSAGITLRPSLVAFTPWTTLEDYLEMFEIVEAEDLIDAVDPVQYSIRLLLPPGSALLAKPEVKRFLEPLDQENFQYRWTHPDPRMDALHQSVTAAVEATAGTDEDPAVTFDRLRGLACAVADRQPADSVLSNRGPARRRLPRLTESWFCCAEPTAGQFRPLQPQGHGEG
ncbi:MAG: B12-binding domain-containing radical SAM protein [Nitrospirae bacterium]|nr:B12-binding domain-containing radical SAM protein [Nitrospirota bacterium]